MLSNLLQHSAVVGVDIVRRDKGPASNTWNGGYLASQLATTGLKSYPTFVLLCTLWYTWNFKMIAKVNILRHIKSNVSIVEPFPNNHEAPNPESKKRKNGACFFFRKLINKINKEARK